MFRLITGMRDIYLSAELRQKPDNELEVVSQSTRAKEAAAHESSRKDNFRVDTVRNDRRHTYLYNTTHTRKNNN